MKTFGLAFTATLVDFVWQGTLVVLALLPSLHTIGRRSAQARYALNAAALLVLAALPIVTTVSRYNPVEPGRVEAVTAVASSVVAGVDDPLAKVDLWHNAAPSLTPV